MPGGTPVTDQANTLAAVAIANTTPRVTPTVSQSVRIDWGSWFVQGLSHEKAIIEAAALGGLEVALSNVPFGAIALHFIGPQLIDQYIEMGIKALDGVAENLVIEVPGDSVFAVVANLINANEPAFAKFIGDKLEPMLKLALTSRGVKLS